MAYSVYLITNNVNGMQYVGQTSTDVETRFKRHYYARARKRASYGRELNFPLGDAMVQYGLGSFDVKTLAVADTRYKALKIEAKYIRELNTIFPNGYNLTTSENDGKRSSERTTSEETSKRLSAAAKSYWDNATEEQKREHHLRMLEGHRKKGWGPMPPQTREALRKANTGRKMSDEHKKIVSRTAKEYWRKWREEHPKPIEMKIDKRVFTRCVETGEVFQSTKQAAESKGIKNHIGAVIRGQRKTCGGYHWEEVQSLDRGVWKSCWAGKF